MSSLPTTTQFRSSTTQSGKRAFEAWCAVHRNGEKNIVIAAPTIEALQEAWKQFDNSSELRVEAAQHVWIVAFNGELKDAPDVSPAAAKVACQFCGRQASFIKNKIATCERRECKEKAE